jgi:formylglycine-generating enzyme
MGLAVVVVLLISPLTARANVTWALPAGQSGDWAVASNWGGSVPTVNDTAYVVNGGTATITQFSGACDALVLGSSAEAGTLQMIGSSSHLSASFEYVGDYGTGTFMQTGGTNRSQYLFSLGWNTGGSGYYSLSGGLLVMGGVEYLGYFGAGTFFQSGGTNQNAGVYLGYYAGVSGTYNLNGVLLSDDEYVGYNGTGTFSQAGGTNRNEGGLYVGYNAGSRGTYSLSGGQSYGDLFVGSNVGSSGTCNFSGGLLSGAIETVGENGTGIFSQSGGDNQYQGLICLGFNAGSSGTYNLSGGLVAGGEEEVGYSGTGTFTQSSGTNQNLDLYVGYSAGSRGTYNLSNGQLAVGGYPGEYMGYSGTGTFNQSGGTNSVTNGLILAYDASSAGTYNLNGGLLVLSALGQGSGTATFNFGGGTLGASAAWSSSLSMNLSGIGGPATIDASGGSISLSGNLSGNGGLTEVGSGLLILSGSNTYTGGTKIETGTLVVLNSTALPDGSSLTVGAVGTLLFNPAAHLLAVESLAAQASPIPEPSTLALLIVGAAGLLAFVWRRRRLGQTICMTLVLLSTAGLAKAANVFNMGGTISGGTWTGLASLQFVTVGDAGNLPDPATGNLHASVPYVFQMGKYDVTLGQYTAFLNAVAKTDTYGLYNSGMASDFYYFGISQGGSSGSFVYSVTGLNTVGPSHQTANLPVFDVTWGDAARFCNWLQNGQPTGAEGITTTEQGAYTLDGGTSQSALMAVTRNGGAQFFIPNVDESYKAAYYVGGGTNAGYWTYPTQSNTVPSNILSATGTNNANYGRGPALTPVGYLADSPGPYGTYDMGGDVYQWNETAVVPGMFRTWLGGSCEAVPEILSSSLVGVYESDPSTHSYLVGFRVASSEAVPEPSTLALLIVGAAGLLAVAWRRKKHAS